MPRERQCYEFAREGYCSRGDRCKFAHTAYFTHANEREKNGNCVEFSSTGRCKRGFFCKFAHHHDLQGLSSQRDNAGATSRKDTGNSAGVAATGSRGAGARARAQSGGGRGQKRNREAECSDHSSPGFYILSDNDAKRLRTMYPEGNLDD